MGTVSSVAQSNLIRSEVNLVQTQLNDLQRQVSSGLKADRYGDLGSVASLELSLRNESQRVDALNTSLSYLKTRTAGIDQSLNSVHDAGQKLRDLTISGLSSDEGRQTILDLAKESVSQVTNTLNTNVGGRFIFSGVAAATPPMAPDPALLAQVKAAINTALTAMPAPASVPAAIQGAVASVFATPANYYNGGIAYPPTAIEDNFKVDTSIVGNDPAITNMLQGMYTIAALDPPVADPATLPAINRTDFDATVTAAATQMYSGVGGIQNLIAKNGLNQTQIDNASTRHEATLTVVKSQINDIESVDLADASAKITQLRTQLEASFQLTAQLQSLSLVKYL
jgi:flagellar hook-associated protein 3 FlgL